MYKTEVLEGIWVSRRCVLIGMCLLITLLSSSCAIRKKGSEQPMGDGKTVLYQVAREELSLMMCYVIKTRNNKLIVIDGGIDGHGKNAEVYLLDVLKDIQGTEKPEIEAWFFSHIHPDHVNEFRKMVDSKKGQFTVNKIYFHFPTREFMQRTSPSALALSEQFGRAFNELKGLNAYELYVPPMVGYKIQIDNVTFEILQVPDNETTANAINNSCMVFRMTAEGQTVLFLGDLGVEGGVRLLNTYRDALKSDMVQMAHHGQAGVDKDVYEAIDPKVCLWPTPIWVWENKDSNGVEGNGPYQTTEVRKWMFEDLGVKHHFVTGLSGTQAIELPYAF